MIEIRIICVRVRVWCDKNSGAGWMAEARKAGTRQTWTTEPKAMFVCLFFRTGIVVLKEERGDIVGEQTLGIAAKGSFFRMEYLILKTF